MTIVIQLFSQSMVQTSRADEVQLTLNDGTVITAEIPNDSLEWTTILKNGELSHQQYQFSEINELVLSSSAANKQVAAVRRWIAQLGSPEYLERQVAEAKLSDAKIGGGFKSLIKKFKNDESYEIRHRIARILGRLNNTDEDIDTEFDTITFKKANGNAKAIEGDAGEFVLNGTYRGKPISLARSDIRMIRQPTKTNTARHAPTPVRVTMFHDYDGEFYLPNQIDVDFEGTPSGSQIKRSTNVDDLYIPWGLRTSGGDSSYVGISGFRFKFAPLPPANNSVCVFHIVNDYPNRFQGILEIKFCMPHQKSIPAGVHEFGLFLARVNHSRDFVIEAYNEFGQLLASVEATDQPCIFAGIKSSQPITRIRILANPHLFRLERTTFDHDYAIDNVCFSPPVAVSNPVGDESTTIRLRNGDVLKCSRIQVTGESSFSFDAINESGFDLKMEEIQSIRFGKKDAPEENHWAAMLDDGSILHVQPGEPFQSLSFEQLSFSVNELTGFWWSPSPARYPQATDFENGPTVMVFPNCRIATDVVFSKTGFNWNANATKIEQPLHTTDDEIAEDPTVQVSKILYAKAEPFDIPSLWNRSPQTPSPETGRIRLADGQQWVLGGSTGFAIESFQDDSVTISVSGQQIVVPFKEILSIQFPSNLK